MNKKPAQENLLKTIKTTQVIGRLLATLLTNADAYITIFDNRRESALKNSVNLVAFLLQEGLYSKVWQS